MNIEWCRGLAAQAWCAESTKNKTMDPDLAEEFAKILMKTMGEMKCVHVSPVIGFQESSLKTISGANSNVRGETE